MLCLKCSGQNLQIEVCEKIADGFINANVVHFDFCERWSGMVKTAQFTQRHGSGLKTYSVIIDDLAGTVAMPNEVKAGDLLISAFGVDPDTGVRITSTIATIKVEPSGFVSDAETPIPPTPDLYSQLLLKINEAANSGALNENALFDALNRWGLLNSFADGDGAYFADGDGAALTM